MKVVKFYRGQILVIIVLGTTIALTVALAVSARTLSTVRQTTTNSRAQAVLAAAEAGAEVALARLKNGECKIAGSCINITSSIPETQTSYSYSVSQGAGSSDPYLFDLIRDQVAQIYLRDNQTSDYYPGTAVDVCWYDPSLDGSPESENALEVIYYGNVTGSTYKYGYIGADPSGGPNLGSTGFSNAGGGRSVTVSGKTVSFNHCQTIPEAPTQMDGHPEILRMRALYSSFSVVIVPQIGKTLPIQSYVIESTGQTSDGTVKKKIRVTKSLPALPTIFDFAIFNGSETEPLAK